MTTMHPCRRVELDWLDQAPAVFRNSVDIALAPAELFEVLMAAPDCLPDGWREQAGEPGSQATAEVVRDYIAGMTDRYALDEHDRLFKLSRERA